VVGEAQANRAAKVFFEIFSFSVVRVRRRDRLAERSL